MAKGKKSVKVITKNGKRYIARTDESGNTTYTETMGSRNSQSVGESQPSQTSAAQPSGTVFSVGKKIGTAVTKAAATSRTNSDTNSISGMQRSADILTGGYRTGTRQPFGKTTGTPAAPFSIGQTGTTGKGSATAPGIKNGTIQPGKTQPNTKILAGMQKSADILRNGYPQGTEPAAPKIGTVDFTPQTNPPDVRQMANGYFSLQPEQRTAINKFAEAAANPDPVESGLYDGFKEQTIRKVMEEDEEAQVNTADGDTEGAAEKTAQANAKRKATENYVNATIYTYHAGQDPQFEQCVKAGSEANSKLKGYLSGAGADIIAVITNDDDALAYKAISEEELETYLYYVGKSNGDDTVANRYLDSILPQLQARAADYLHGQIEGIDNEIGKKIMRWGVTVAGSAQNVKRSIMNMPAAFTGSEDVIAPGTMKQIEGKIRSGLDGPEKVVHNVTSGAVNALPTIAVGSIPGVGTAAAAAMTAATTYSNAYSGAVLSGYEPGQAAAYAIPTAAVDALTQYAIGGIGKLGGSESLAKQVSGAIEKNISSPVLRNAVETLSNSGSSALQSYLQANVDPVLRNLALGENNEIDPFS